MQEKEQGTRQGKNARNVARNQVESMKEKQQGSNQGCMQKKQKETGKESVQEKLQGKRKKVLKNTSQVLGKGERKKCKEQGKKVCKRRIKEIGKKACKKSSKELAQKARKQTNIEDTRMYARNKKGIRQESTQEMQQGNTHECMQVNSKKLGKKVCTKSSKGLAKNV